MSCFSAISFGKRIRLAILGSVALGLAMPGLLSPDNHASAQDDLTSESKLSVAEILKIQKDDDSTVGR